MPVRLLTSALLTFSPEKLKELCTEANQLTRTLPVGLAFVQLFSFFDFKPLNRFEPVIINHFLI